MMKFYNEFYTQNEKAPAAQVLLDKKYYFMLSK